MSTMEWGIFRKGDATTIPAENVTYPTRESAEKTLKRSYRQPELYEVRGREIGPWDAKAKEATT